MTDLKAAYPFLLLLEVEKRFNNELSKIVLHIVEHDDFAPEAVYDRVHDWRLARRKACDDAIEQVYDLLHKRICNGNYVERENFQRAQAARRRRARGW